MSGPKIFVPNNRLRSLRENKSLSLVDVARELGYNVQNLSQIESGERSFSLVELMSFAKFYHVSTDYVMESPIVENIRFEAFEGPRLSLYQEVADLGEEQVEDLIAMANILKKK